MTKGYLDKIIIKNIKESFRPGTRIELIKMGNDIHKVPDGTHGIVEYVDDIGTIHMKWETGSSLGLVIGEDLFKVVDEE